MPFPDKISPDSFIGRWGFWLTLGVAVGAILLFLFVVSGAFAQSAKPSPIPKVSPSPVAKATPVTAEDWADKIQESASVGAVTEVWSKGGISIAKTCVIQSAAATTDAVQAVVYTSVDIPEYRRGVFIGWAHQGWTMETKATLQVIPPKPVIVEWDAAHVTP